MTTKWSEKASYTTLAVSEHIFTSPENRGWYVMGLLDALAWKENCGFHMKPAGPNKHHVEILFDEPQPLKELRALRQHLYALLRKAQAGDLVFKVWWKPEMVKDE